MNKNENRFCGNVDNYVACDFTPEEWQLLPERARKSLEENGYVDGKAPEHLKTKKPPEKKK